MAQQHQRSVSYVANINQNTQIHVVLMKKKFTHQF